MVGYNGRGRPFTPEDDAQLEQLRLPYDGRRRFAEGHRLPEPGSIREIARALGRHPASVYKRLTYLAKQDD